MKKEARSRLSPAQLRALDEKKAINRFVTILSVLSIIGFAGIVSEAFFNFNPNNYIEAFLMFFLGVGLLVEVRVQKLKSIRLNGLTRDNFANIIVIIIGLFAIFSGIFSIPQIKINSPAFLSIKGILAIIAISVIAIETWFVKKKY